MISAGSTFAGAEEVREERDERADREADERRSAPRPPGTADRWGRRRVLRGRAPRAPGRGSRGTAGRPCRPGPGRGPSPRRSRRVRVLLVAGWRWISRRSTSISARASSRCEATEVYSPAAIENAPATRPASPASTMNFEPGLGAAVHTGDQREVRHQPVHRPEHRRPQPPTGHIPMRVIPGIAPAHNPVRRNPAARCDLRAGSRYTGLSHEACHVGSRLRPGRRPCRRPGRCSRTAGPRLSAGPPLRGGRLGLGVGRFVGVRRGCRRACRRRPRGRAEMSSWPGLRRRLMMK